MQDHYLNLLKDLSIPLFDLTYENEKPILNDKRMDVAVEIGNMLFRLGDQTVERPTTYEPENFEIVKLLSGTKKQKKVNDLFNLMINNLVYRMSQLVKEVNEKLDEMLVERFQYITDYMSSARNPEEIIWRQSLFDDVRSALKDDVARARYKPSGTKGFGKCGRCNSEELYVNEKQTRSADEPMTVNYLCLACGHTWRRG